MLTDAPLRPGVVTPLGPLVRRVLAPNAGLMTGPGTNTYLVGTSEVAVIDPGPDDVEQHLDLVAAAGGGAVRWILVTHTHPDHAPGAAGLKARTGAPVLGFARREGFAPDDVVRDGWVLEAAEFRLRAMHTPGHASDHLCFELVGEGVLFSGDHVIGGSTVVVAPPDGDMAAYMRALARVRESNLPSAAPGHGPLVADLRATVDEYLRHRRAREAAVEVALRAAGRAGVAELVEVVYTDVPQALHPLAGWSVWAHLRKLAAEGRARSSDPDDPDGIWRP